MHQGRLRFLRSFLLFLFAATLAACSRYDGKPLQGYVEGQYSNLSPIVSGKLMKLTVDRGDQVKAGQLLFVLENEPEASKLQQAEAQMQSERARLIDASYGERATEIAARVAQVDQAKADSEKAQKDFERNRYLYGKGVIDKATFDNAELSYKSLQHRVEELTANLKNAQLGDRYYQLLAQSNTYQAALAAASEAKWELSQKKVYAPADGFIFDTFFNEGEEISASQPVVSLLTPDNVKLIFFVPQERRAHLQLGDEVEFTCDGCDKSYRGKIYYISPQAEFTPPVIYSRESRSKLIYRVEARLTVETAKAAHPGQPVEVYLLKKQNHDQPKTVRH